MRRLHGDSHPLHAVDCRAFAGAQFERHLKSPQRMRQLFSDLPEALADTVELSSRLEFTLEALGCEFPKYPVPEGETMNSFLRERTRDGFQQRYGCADAGLQGRAHRQIERELALIEKLKLAGYFLIVWDLVRFCREQSILVQGRGSAANSAVFWGPRRRRCIRRSPRRQRTRGSTGRWSSP